MFDTPHLCLTRRLVFDTPQFRPIIDTTGAPHYNVGKFLAELLNPLAHNEYTLRDSFHAVSDLKSIPNELFTQGYRLVSFDVVSLFTNVPLKRTVQIILDRVFKGKWQQNFYCLI